MQHRQSLIPRTDVIVALGLKMGQERSHMTGRQIGERKLGDSSVGRLGKKEEEQTNPVALTSNRCLRKTFLYFEVVFEEHVDQAADRHHDLPPLDSGAANRSNRRAAASRSSAVMVR